jgi:hypothetical protein
MQVRLNIVPAQATNFHAIDVIVVNGTADLLQPSRPYAKPEPFANCLNRGIHSLTHDKLGHPESMLEGMPAALHISVQLNVSEISLIQ